MLHIQNAFTSNDADKVQFDTTTNQFRTPAQPNDQQNVGVSGGGSNCQDAPMSRVKELICHCIGEKCVRT
jgi:hypothetical protein